METGIVKTEQPQLPTITSLSKDELYFLQVQGDYTIRQYISLKVKDPVSGHAGEQLAQYLVGNAITLMCKMLGIKKEGQPDAQLGRIIAKYIVDTFHYIRPREITDAIEFALQNKFPIGKKDGGTLLDHYGIIDLKFISDFLNAFVKWRYDKTQSVEDKIKKAGSKLTYSVLIDMMIRDDKVLKDAIVGAFEAFKNKPDHFQSIKEFWFRDVWFDWYVEIGLIPYDREFLNDMFRKIKAGGNITSDQAKQRARAAMIEKAFSEMEKKDFDKLNDVCYVSWQALGIYYSKKISDRH